MLSELKNHGVTTRNMKKKKAMQKAVQHKISRYGITQYLDDENESEFSQYENNQFLIWNVCPKTPFANASKTDENVTECNHLWNHEIVRFAACLFLLFWFVLLFFTAFNFCFEYTFSSFKSI